MSSLTHLHCTSDTTSPCTTALVFPANASGYEGKHQRAQPTSWTSHCSLVSLSPRGSYSPSRKAKQGTWYTDASPSSLRTERIQGAHGHHLGAWGLPFLAHHCQRHGSTELPPSRPWFWWTVIVNLSYDDQCTRTFRATRCPPMSPSSAMLSWQPLPPSSSSVHGLAKCLATPLLVSSLAAAWWSSSQTPLSSCTASSRPTKRSPLCCPWPCFQIGRLIAINRD